MVEKYVPERTRAKAALSGAVLEREFRALAGAEAPEPTVFGAVRPETKFDQRMCAAIIKNEGNIAAAYRDVTGLELPTPEELRGLREKWNRLTSDEALTAGYANPSKDIIVAMLVEKALHAHSDAVQIAAASQLAALMPGWKAPTQSQNIKVTGKMEEFVKAVTGFTHEPGRAEKVSERD